MAARAASKATLVLGGVRSGKSAFAEKLAAESGSPVLYVATGLATDCEMRERIRRHQESRPADWSTLEEPLALPGRLRERMGQPGFSGVVLVDSVDVWTANLLLEHQNEDKEALESLALVQTRELLSVARESPADFILVSSEVGHSLVPVEPLGRRFQDLLGLVNQELAAGADRVYMVAAGIPSRLKP